jgi:hypothetical protein
LIGGAVLPDEVARLQACPEEATAAPDGWVNVSASQGSVRFLLPPGFDHPPTEADEDVWAKDGLRVSVHHDRLDSEALQGVSHDGRCQTVIGDLPVMIVKKIKYQPHSYVAWFLRSLPDDAVVVEVSFAEWDDLAVVRHILGSVEVGVGGS